MTKNTNAVLHKANKQKNDEFYTDLKDIENEMKYYKDYFRNKIVFCNCDDYRKSNFVKYFHNNFKELGLRTVYSIGYNTRTLCTKTENGVSISKIPADSFDSEYSKWVLNISDVVVTNPPFSLFREYMDVLINSGKKFIILGSHNAIGYKEIFPYFIRNELRLGETNYGTKWFKVPNEYEIETKSRQKVVNGQQYFSLGNCVWYTNIDNGRIKNELKLTKKYNPIDYPKYDNLDGIEVGKVTDIPMDYDGLMGVPMTFMDKYNPYQFAIVGFRKGKDGKDLRVNGKDKFSRVIIRKIS